MIPLTVRSYYSLMWGVHSPQEICATARRLGYERIALTDTDNLYGLWPFLKSCRRENITPIVGAEMTDPVFKYRAVCLVENDDGYRNLCRLITQRHNKKKPFDLKKALLSHGSGLTVITQSADLLSHLCKAGITAAAAVPRRPGNNFFRLRKMARYFDVPVVATPGSFFLGPEDFKIHRLLRAIDMNTSFSRLTSKDTAPPDAWLAPAAEYARRFAPWPEVIRATRDIAKRLVFTGPGEKIILPPWNDSKGESTEDVLRSLAYKGAKKRYGEDLAENVVDRIEHELRIIAGMGFSSYFLVVKDIVSRSPRICGRGSGAASLVAYCLGITNVCPVKHNLYFERFLNPGRSDPPDIDVDFAWDERDNVLSSVLKQYDGHAALVCNHVAFQPRMAVREVAKVFGLTNREIGRVTKRLPWFWRKKQVEDDMLSQLKQLPELDQIDFSPPWPRILNMARRIISIPRYISVHPGGVVITPGPLDHYVPVEPAPKGVPVIQWEKDAAEEGGLVKIDLLGNRSLGVIRDAIANIRDNGIKFDEQSWEPEDDPATQKTVAGGNTMGCFYIESPAMKLLQKKTQKGDFEHLVIHSSIIRPAANEFIREYIRRLKGAPWEPVHPLLSEVLEETYGIMVYQEDVAKTAVALAGFSHADADGLRKIMSKKDKEQKLGDYREQFTRGAKKKGLDNKQIDRIWDMMLSFSGYSFCKPHSASYARVSFQAAFLKTHQPAEFMAAVISNQGGFYSAFAYVSEARRMGIKILPPHINKSDIPWKGKDDAIRVGLISIKNLSGDTRRRIVNMRKSEVYRNLEDFMERTKPGEPEIRSLIHAGAFDDLNSKKNRTALLWRLACRGNTGSGDSKQKSLFSAKTDLPEPLFPPENEKDRLRREFAAMGFLCDRHPMTLYGKTLGKRQIVKVVDLPNFTGKHVQIAGLLITGKVVHTKQGEPMEFLTFEDETGRVETTFFPHAYRRFCSILDDSRPFIICGKVEEDFGAVTLTVNSVRPLFALGDNG